MREQATAANRMMERMGRNAENHAAHNVENPAARNEDYNKFSEFREANPPPFRGTFDLNKAVEWIKAMDKIFSVTAYTEEQKVAFATYMLVADAEFWWTGTRRLFEASHTVITWDIFKEAFFKKYFPLSVRNAKELEFMGLKQGDMSVAKYTAKFEELSKFSTIYQRNPDEEWKCMKYEGGLREDIQAAVGLLEIRDYSTLVNKCRLVEEYNRKIARSESVRTDTGKRLAPEEWEYEDNPTPKKQYQPGPYNDKQPQRSAVAQDCPRCGRNHEGRPCLAGQYVCYRCGRPGHKIWECPDRVNPDIGRRCSNCGKDHGSRPCLAGRDVCFGCGKLGHKRKECPDRHLSSTTNPQHLKR